MDIDYLHKNLPSFDIALGLRNCGGEISDYLEILKINYEYGHKSLDELETLLTKKDYENYTIKIHSMKSTTKNMGAMRVSDMARKQEEAGRAGEYDHLGLDFAAFRAKYESLLREIEEVLRHYHLIEEQANSPDSMELDRKVLDDILTNIQMHVDAFDFDAVFEILKNRKQYRLPQEYEELFDKLEAAMEELDVDTVRSLVRSALAEEP